MPRRQAQAYAWRSTPALPRDDMTPHPLRQAVNHLQAGRWADAHELAQQDDSPLGAWLHGILHLEEGDLGNAEYWFGRANRNFRSRGTVAQELAAFEAALPEGRVTR
jgi:hypothetical protein